MPAVFKKYQPQIVGFGLVAIVIIGYGVLVIRQSRELLDQVNTAPKTHTYVISPGEAGRQSFVPQRDNVSAVAIEYDPEHLQAQQTLELTLERGGTQLRQVRGPVSNFIVDYLWDDLPSAHWLRFDFPAVKVVPGEELLMRLRNTSSSPFGLPIQRDPQKYGAGELKDLPHDWRGDLGFITYAQASWRQKIWLDLVNDSHFIRLYLLFAAGVLAVVGWQILDRWRTGVHLLPARPWFLFFALAVVLTAPLYTNMTLWGVWDWPEVVSHYSAARHSLAAGQWPLWNPYFCGGNPSWGNPQTYWPSFAFLLTQLFGDRLGTKVAVTIYLWVGMMGMYLLARQLKLNRYAALLPAVIFLGNGFLMAHMAAGQMLWLTVAWIPWVVLFWLRSLRRPGNIVPAVFFYLLIFFEGRVHLVAYVALLILLLSVGLLMARKQRWPIIRSLIFFACLTVGLGAVKILPTFDFLSGLEGELGKLDGTSWNHLFEVWLNRNEGLTYNRGWTILPWHEHAAYVGILPLLAAAAGLVWLRGRKTLAVMAAIGIIFLTIVTAAAGQSLFDKLPVVSTLRNHGRAMSVVILAIALLAGWGAQRVAWFLPSRPLRKLGVVFIALFVFLDFFLLAAWPLSRIFRIDPYSYSEPYHGFYQVQSRSDVGYDVVQRQLGARNWCPPQLLLWNGEASIYARGDEQYRGEVYAAGASEARLHNFTANQVAVIVESVAAGGDIIYLNQKYAPGWRSPEKEIFGSEGRIAFEVNPVDAGRVIYLRFWPRSFTVGILISLFTAILLVALYVRKITTCR